MSLPEVEVKPADLSFRFQLNKQLLATITITNPHKSQLAYKIKTTAPKKYVVRPSSGIAEPLGSVSIQVIMQAQKEFPADFANCKDKFMVQTTQLAEGEEIGDATFQKESRGDLKEARLRVVLDGPAMPSPVREDESSERAVDDQAETRLKTTMSDLSVASSENATLKAKLDALGKERDTLRKKLDQMELQVASKGGSATESSKFSLNIIHIIVAAILAFLVGMYLK